MVLSSLHYCYGMIRSILFEAVIFLQQHLYVPGIFIGVHVV